MIHAVDRQALADLVWFGVYCLLVGDQRLLGLFQELESMYPYGPAKAKQLLDEAAGRRGPAVFG